MDNISAIAFDSSDNKWIGSNRYVQKFDDKNWFTYTIPYNAFIIHDIEVDIDGNVWFAHEAGISKYDGSSWEHITGENSNIPTPVILSMKIRNDGNLFFGSLSSYIYQYNMEEWFVHTPVDYLTETIVSIAIDDSGNIWTGSQDYHGGSLGALGKFDGKQYTFLHGGNSTLPTSGLISLAIDKYQNKWIGKTFEGLIKYNDTVFTQYMYSNSGIPDRHVYSIAIDDDDVKWIGTQQGLAKFDNEEWTVWNTSNSDLPNDSVRCIVIDKQGNKWTGTNNGLAVFREGGVILGAEDQSASGELTINTYPNPTGDKLNISISNAGYANISLKIYDIYGREIETIYQRGGYDITGDFNRPSNNITYDSAKLSAGTYLLLLTADNIRKAAKVEIVK